MTGGFWKVGMGGVLFKSGRKEDPVGVAVIAVPALVRAVREVRGVDGAL